MNFNQIKIRESRIWGIFMRLEETLKTDEHFRLIFGCFRLSLLIIFKIEPHCIQHELAFFYDPQSSRSLRKCIIYSLLYLMISSEIKVEIRRSNTESFLLRVKKTLHYSNSRAIV